MDLTRQPPRRPSNAQVAGIVGLARMIDKARGHNAETIGEFKYGDDSGLDVEVLEFINMDAAEFAEAVAELDDETLGVMALERAQKGQSEIDAFNEEHLTREPQDELHERLLVERIAKYAPDRTDIKTVFASIELDDWGAFRDLDLTSQPPRSPYLRSVFGVAGTARMADKATGSHLRQVRRVPLRCRLQPRRGHLGILGHCRGRLSPSGVRKSQRRRAERVDRRTL